MSDFDIGPFFAGFGKGSGRFAGQFGLIAVSTEFSKGSAVMRNAKGQFVPKVQADVALIGQQLALELAQSTARAAKASMLRPRVSSGRLQSAILDPRNRVGTQFGYGVGRPLFLDRSEAKYWRQIDQGFSGHVGREIRGVFGNRKGPFTGSSRSGPYMIPTGQFTAIGAGAPIGKLYPLGRQSALRLLRNSRKSGRLRRMVRTESTIEKPISPQQYFLRGWEDFNAKSRTTAAVKAALEKNLPPGR